MNLKDLTLGQLRELNRVVRGEKNPNNIDPYLEKMIALLIAVVICLFSHAIFFGAGYMLGTGDGCNMLALCFCGILFEILVGIMMNRIGKNKER